MNNKSGIYWIRNLVNGKVYIGSAVCFRKRFAQLMVLNGSLYKMALNRRSIVNCLKDRTKTSGNYKWEYV